MSVTWAVQDAKNKFSELVDTAVKKGAQTITRHGKPVAIILSAKDYANLTPRETLATIMRSCPVKDWDISRSKDTARDNIDFS